MIEMLSTDIIGSIDNKQPATRLSTGRRETWKQN